MIINSKILILNLYAGILASIVILYAAFQYMTSAGDESKAGQAKQTLYWAIIGVAVITLSFLIVAFIGQLGGYQGITTVPPSP
ncbi:MAG: hypothetical protein UR93_C0030G0005 [Berkelbacteria bacterium GW2011_GWA2_35_9]|uniref:Uncharacterized protein n=1 Tax=Berkelbacteria bacterium GW2011_GWA2_35_9 TaxID=1618333 RepID=A0A0G0G7Y1_9BACT|nr:MAG: hypothetical protein UR93_C0030G0005 [Berkelbacteria bacterium GW2011_GWA2_35_9]